MNTTTQEFGQLLKVRGFPAFLAFRTIKGFGGWIQVALAYPVLVFHFNASPATLGIAVFLTGLPFIVLGPYLGAMADRRSPVAMMVFGSGYRVAGLAALGWAPSVEVFIIVMFFNAVAGSASAAEPVVLSRLLTDEKIRAATSLGGFLDQSTKLIAPLIGGVMATWGYAQQGYYLLSFMALLTFVCALALGRTLGWAPPPARDQPRRGRIRELTITFRELPVIRYTVLLAVGVAITMGMHSAVLIFLLQENRLPAAAYGMSMSATAAGYILATLTISKWMKGREVRVMALCGGGFCGTILVQGLWGMSSHDVALVPLVAIWILSGYFFGAKMLCYITLMQTRSPKDRVGLVMASSQSLLLLVLQIAPLIGVALTDWHSAGLAYVVAAVAGLGTLVWIHGDYADLQKTTRQ